LKQAKNKMKMCAFQIKTFLSAADPNITHGAANLSEQCEPPMFASEMEDFETLFAQVIFFTEIIMLIELQT